MIPNTTLIPCNGITYIYIYTLNSPLLPNTRAPSNPCSLPNSLFSLPSSQVFTNDNEEFVIESVVETQKTS